jgi:ASCH domain
VNTAVAVSVQQPWAELLLDGIKDVENRSWPTGYRGPLIIHAGQRVDRAALDELPAALLAALPTPLPTGLLGRVDLLDCVQGHPSRWAVPGQWHWVVANPVRFPQPIAFPGRLRLFAVPTSVLAPAPLSPPNPKLPI